MLKFIAAFFGLAGSVLASGQIVLGFSWPEDLPPSAIAATPDGGFIATLGPDVAKFDATGHRDASFHSGLGKGDFYPSIIVPDAEGNYFVGPNATIDKARYGLVKIDGTGALVNEFTPVTVTGAAQSASASIGAIAADGAGGAYLGGTFTSLNGVLADGLAHVDSAGSVQAINRPARLAGNTPTYLARVASGLLIVYESDAFVLMDSGAVRELEIPQRGKWARLRGGSADSRFGFALIATYIDGGSTEYMILVWNFDGSLKREFQQKVVFGPQLVSTVQWDSKGRLLLANAQIASMQGAASDDGSLVGVKRLMADGSVDPVWSHTLSFNGLQSTIAVSANDDVLVGGVFTKVAGLDRSKAVRLSGDSDNGLGRPPTSARGLVSSQNDVIMGLVIPDTGYSVDVLIRAMSQSLRRFGVSRTVFATKYSVFRGQQNIRTVTVQNSSQNAEFVSSQIGALPRSQPYEEAQQLISLEPGVYTVVISPVAGDSGEILGEIYFPR